MTNFLMLVGLAGSGKSHFAKQLLEDNSGKPVILLSSDEIRKELYGKEEIQGDPKEVFKIMLERTKKSLDLGVSVIYDATNINRKKRKGLLTQLPKSVTKTVFYIHTPINKVYDQNDSRERKVPPTIINNMYKNLHVPIESEGWDNIEIVVHDSILDFPDQVKQSIRAGVSYYEQDYNTLITKLSEFFDEFLNIAELAHDSTYHNFSVSRHTYHVYRYVYDNYDEIKDKCDKELIIWVALLHDVGKRFCKSFYDRKGNEQVYANFIGHENVSAQLAVKVLTELGFSQEFILKATKLIQFHMYLLNENNNKKKLKQYVGEDNYEILEFIRKADNYAH